VRHHVTVDSPERCAAGGVRCATFTPTRAARAVVMVRASFQLSAASALLARRPTSDYVLQCPALEMAGCLSCRRRRAVATRASLVTQPALPRQLADVTTGATMAPIPVIRACAHRDVRHRLRGGLWVCDRWMASRAVADDATTAAATSPATTRPRRRARQRRARQRRARSCRRTCRPSQLASTRRTRSVRCG
jgi:hypothetical protein